MISLFRKISYVLLWLTVFTMPFQKNFIIPGVGSLNKVFGLGLVLVGFFTVLLKGELKKLPLFHYLLIGFLFLNILSYFWSDVPLDTLNNCILYIQLAVLCWSIYEFASDQKRFITVLKAYVLGCTVIALQTLYQFLTGNYTVVSGTRLFIEGYNPNQLGILWSLSLPIAMFLIIKGFKTYIIYVPIAAFSILLTASRTGLSLLIFIVISFFWLLFRYRINDKKIKYRKTIAFVFVILGIFIFSQIPEGQFERLSTLKYEMSTGTLNGRTTIWRSGIETFKQHPILGVGSGAFADAAVENSVTGEAMSAHNGYLAVLVENGMIGFILFLCMPIFAMVKILRIEKNNPYRWLGLTLITSWFILSAVSHSQAQKYTWIIFGMVLTTYFVAKNNKTNENVMFSQILKPLKRRIFRKRIVW